MATKYIVDNLTGQTITGNLTINGNLSVTDNTIFDQNVNVNIIAATTISGGTFYSDGSNLTGVGGGLAGINYLQSLENDTWIDDKKDAFQMTYRECESIKESLMGSYTEDQIKDIVDFSKSKPITEEEKQELFDLLKK